MSEPTRLPRGTGVLATALSLAAIDLTGATLLRPSRLDEPRLLAVSLALSLLGLLGAAVVVAGAVGLAARLRHRDDVEALQAAALVGAAALYATLAVDGRVPLRLEPVALLRIGLASVASVPAAYGAYALARARRERPALARVLMSAVLATPFVLLVVLALAWQNLYRLGRFSSWPSVGTNLAGAVVALACIAAAGLPRVRSRARGVLAALAVVVSVTPLVPRPAAGTPGATPAPGAPRLVLLVTVDTLRADALSCYRQPGAVATPHIDALADDGLLFEDAESSAPWTTPSVVSVITGLAPETHGVTTVRTTDVPDGLVTLGNRMREAGYRTAALLDSGFLAMARGLTAGFDEADLFPRPAPDASLGGRLFGALHRDELQRYPGAEVLTPRAIDVLRRHRGQPLFLWIHYFDPHGPFDPPRELLKGLTPAPRFGFAFHGEADVRNGFVIPTLAERDWIGTLYREQVPPFDASLGRLLDAVRELGEYDDALVAFTADHGEELWDHGFFGHGQSLHRELLWVPLVVKLPGNAPRGRVAARARLVDVAPTLLDVAGVRFDPSQFTGASLAPVWSGTETEPRVAVGGSCGSHADLESASFEHWKYVRDRVTGRETVYDVATDPHEQDPVQPPPAQVVEEGRRLVVEYQRSAESLRRRLGLGAAATGTIAPDRREELRALGYVQ